MSKTAGFVEHRLENGLRVVIEPMPHVRSASAGFLVKTGARDETPALAGISHFLEHMCFKGTQKRDWRQITIDFDNLGSTYNAYTSKERTFYFGWVRTEDLEKQVELLADMMRSSIPADEFDTEKKVILEEIAGSNDQLDRTVYDFIHEKVYSGHALAWPVLGTQESVGALEQEQMRGYFDERYHVGNMILIIAGAVDPADAVAIAERICGSWKGGKPRPDRIAPPKLPEGAALRQTDRFQQQVLAYLHPSSSGKDPDREDANVMASILGGHNSRFFWNIVQKGVAPYVWSGRLDYCDQGMMLLGGFCEPEKLESLQEAILREVGKVSESGVTDEEVSRVKNRVRTALATEAESPYHRLMQMVQDVDVLGRPRSVSERIAAIDAVTPSSIQAHLERWPVGGKGYLASVGPRDWPKL